MTTAERLPITSLQTTKPDFTLAPGILAWTMENIRQPDGPKAGGPWFFTPEQVSFLEWWYAVDHRGRFLYRRGVLRRMKGWGKSPVMAALAIAELCGPVRFDRFEGGRAVGVEANAPWVQLAGVSEKQAVNNTMSMVLAMLVESPLQQSLDIGKTRIYTPDGGRLEYVTASAPTGEGARPTFVVQDETHHWKSANGGHALDEVNRRNLAKSRDGSARMLETTNAHLPGEDSVAERSWEAWQRQLEGKGSGLLYDTLEAPADVELSDPDDLMFGLECARGDSTWLDLERIRDEIYDPATPASMSRRFYLNQLTHAMDSWLSQPEWNARYEDRVVADREPVVLGFDGSRGRAKGIPDSTVLMGCTLDGHLFEILVLEPPEGPHVDEWTPSATEVDAAIRMAFSRWNVVGFYADPALWEDHVARWEAEHGASLTAKATRDHPISFRMNRPTVVNNALESLHTAIVNGEMTHSGEFAMTRHFLNARLHASPGGTIIVKPERDGPRKIDAAYAGTLAWQARLDAIAKGAGTQKQPTFVPRRIH